MFNFFSEIKSKFKNINEVLTPYNIVIIGGKIFYVEGQISLITINSDIIVFKVDKNIVSVKGKKLNIKDITNNSLTILGEILSWEKI